MTIDGWLYEAPKRLKLSDIHDEYTLTTTPPEYTAHNNHVTFSVVLGEHDKVLPNGDVKTPDGTWHRNNVNANGEFTKNVGSTSDVDASGNVITYPFTFEPDDPASYTSTKFFRNAMLLRQDGNVIAVPGMTISSAMTVRLFNDSVDEVSHIDLSKVLPIGTSVSVVPADSEHAAFSNNDRWDYDTTTGILTHKWLTKAPSPIGSLVKLDVNKKGEWKNGSGSIFNDHYYFQAYGPKAKTPSYVTDLQWSNDHTVAMSPPLTTSLIKQRFGNVAALSNLKGIEQYLYWTVVFPEKGQPKGAQLINLESDSLFNIASFPMFNAFPNTPSKHSSMQLKVPGEGTWTTVGELEGDEFAVRLMFEPEPGFTGTPTPIKYAMLDANMHQEATQIFGGVARLDENAWKPIWGNLGYIPDVKSLFDRYMYEPQTAFVKHIVAPNDTPTWRAFEEPNVRHLVVNQGETAPAPQTGIENMSQYPTGTTVSWKRPPKTTSAGEVTGDAVITLPNGETIDVVIPVTVLAVQKDTYVTNITKNKDGNYDIYRSDIAGGTKVWKTIDLTDLRNKIAALENNQSPTAQDFKKVKDALNKTQASVNNLEQTTNTKFDAVNTELKTLTSNLNRVEGLTIASIVADGKGGYKLKRNNGEMVAGTIDTTTGSITNVASDGKGNITVTIDGEQRTVPLDKVRITETNKGTPQHTVTLTVPGGKSVTFKVFDNYVTDVKKNAQGNYDIYRSDVAGGKTVWKTIDLADLRAQIAALEQKQSPTAQEFNAVREQLREYETLLQSSTTQLRGDVDALRSDLSNITGRVDGIEARLSTVEARQDAWAKCYSGAAMAAIPAVGITLVALISQAHIPGIAQANTNLQQQLGIYRPELTSGTGNAHLSTAAQIAPIIAGVAGLLGAIAYAANACKEYNNTKAVQNTPFGKLNAQLGSSK